jgi:hypothetical protein
VDPARTVPRSVLLALWLAQPAAAAAHPTARRTALAAIQGTDEPHVVEGLGPDPTGLEDLLTGLGPLREVAAVLPVPGGLGLPPEVAGLALDAGEAVVALGDTGGWAVVPEVVPFGTAAEPGHLVTWRVRTLPGSQRSLAGTLGTLGEAHQDLRTTLLQAVHALDDLDVSRWRPEAADELARLRSGPVLGALPAGLDRRVVGVLIEALRLLRIVALAQEDHGGAVNVWQADQRSTALREVGRAARRAVAAATLAAGRDPGELPGQARTER